MHYQSQQHMLAKSLARSQMMSRPTKRRFSTTLKFSSQRFATLTLTTTSPWTLGSHTSGYKQMSLKFKTNQVFWGLSEIFQDTWNTFLMTL
jgi:hypothetical protein